MRAENEHRAWVRPMRIASLVNNLAAIIRINEGDASDGE